MIELYDGIFGGIAVLVAIATFVVGRIQGWKKSIVQQHGMEVRIEDLEKVTAEMKRKQDDLRATVNPRDRLDEILEPIRLQQQETYEEVRMVRQELGNLVQIMIKRRD